MFLQYFNGQKGSRNRGLIPFADVSLDVVPCIGFLVALGGPDMTGRWLRA